MRTRHQTLISPILFFFGIALCGLLVYPVRSTGVDIPHTFTAGTPAVADEVNANFAALQAVIVDQQTAIEALQASIDTLESDLATANSTVADLESQVAGINNSSIMELGSHLDEISSNNFALTGINLHLRNGEGQTASANGLGNLIIGYNESHPNPINRGRRGSHYLVAGAEHQWTGYGGIVVGLRNMSSGNYASVSGGRSNTASGNYSSVSGGDHNNADGGWSSILGGFSQTVTTNSGHYP